MDQDLFKYLPSEIILNILSRLPARTIMSCKCVCNPWLDLLTTPEFVNSHISKSVPGLALLLDGENSKPYKIVEFEDEHHWNIVFNLDLPFFEPLHSSANGLLFLHKGASYRDRCLVLCNPITRDYIKIPSPRQPLSKLSFWAEIYGFGVSRMSCQYKVVRVFIERAQPIPPGFQLVQSQCQVYTVGTGSWRGIASDGLLRNVVYRAGAFLNGNLHWLAFNGSSLQISCLDLDTEVFSTFSPPPLDEFGKSKSLSALGDCLCVCDYTKYLQTSAYEFHIWLMKDYGDEKSWTKEFVIRTDDMENYLGYLCPIKVFRDGDILMEVGFDCKLVYYSSKTKTIQEAGDMFGLETNSFNSSTIFSPSFLSLKTFAMENVTSFCDATSTAPVRKSSRQRQAPVRYQDYMKLGKRSG